MPRTIIGHTYSFTPTATNAITLNGSSQYGKVLNSAALNGLTDFTVEGWFKQNSTSVQNYAQIFRIEDGSAAFEVINTENDTPSTGINWGVTYSGTPDADGYKSTGVFDLDIWVHVAHVHDSAAKIGRIYKNGVEISYTSQNTGSGTIQSSNGMDIWYGVTRTGSNFFKGDVGGFLRVWNTTRTAIQLLANKNYYLDPSQETGLIQAFNFGEGSGTTIANQVTGGNAMTLFATPSWTTGPALLKSLNYTARSAAGVRTLAGTRTLTT